MLKNKKWDVRCSEEIRQMFPIRKGYWYKITMIQAAQLTAKLSRLYKINLPWIARLHRSSGLYGRYDSGTKTIFMHSRGHIKTVVHEFYHHLDYMTKGKYNSNDRRGGSSSLGWQFADRWWAVFREKEG